MINNNINFDYNYKVFDIFPTNAGLYIKEKNIIYFVLLIPVFLLSYAQFNNPNISLFSNSIRIILALILIGIGFYNINQTPKIRNLKIEDNSLTLDKEKLDFTEIQGFEIVDLGNYLEVVLLTTRLTSRFEYFYLETDQNKENITNIVNLLLAQIKYIQDLSDKDIVHRLARRLYVK